MLRASLELYELTAGAFDIILGGGRRGALESSGDRFQSAPGAWLDLGGIGKGAAVARMIRLLSARGVDAAIVSFGGSSIGVLGSPPSGKPWRIVVRSPDGGSAATLAMTAGCLSTSGNYENTSAHGNHVVDPGTGRPANSGLRSATVLTADPVRAEGLSTALLVLGLERGLALQARLGGFEAVVSTAAAKSSAPRAWGSVRTSTAPVERPPVQQKAESRCVETQVIAVPPVWRAPLWVCGGGQAPCPHPASSGRPMPDVVNPQESPTVAVPTPAASPVPTPPASGERDPSAGASADARRRSRSRAAWFALVVGVVVLIFMLVFILQNNVPAQFTFLAWEFSIPLGVAVLFAGIGGALVTAMVGTIRMIVLGRNVRKLERARGSAV